MQTEWPALTSPMAPLSGASLLPGHINKPIHHLFYFFLFFDGALVPSTHPSCPTRDLLRALLSSTPHPFKHCRDAYIAQITLECHSSLLVMVLIFGSSWPWMALSLQKIWIQNRKKLLLLHPLIHCCDTTLNKVNGPACGDFLYQAALRVRHLFVQLYLQSIASSTLFGSPFFFLLITAGCFWKLFGW